MNFLICDFYCGNTEEEMSFTINHFSDRKGDTSAYSTTLSAGWKTTQSNKNMKGQVSSDGPKFQNSNQGNQQSNFSYQTIQDSRSKSVKRPHPINPSPPGQAMYPTNLKYSNHPPPNQAHYPQSSYPPYPQSFFTTPPPGDGPQFAWSTGSRTQTAGLAGSTTVQTGFSRTRTGQAESSGYPQQWATTGVTDYQ